MALEYDLARGANVARNLAAGAPVLQTALQAARSAYNFWNAPATRDYTYGLNSTALVPFQNRTRAAPPRAAPGRFVYGGNMYRTRRGTRVYGAGRKRSRVRGRSRVGNYGRYPPLGQELKFLDTDMTDGLISATGRMEPSLNLIPQSTGESARIGRKCVIRSIGLHLSCEVAEGDAVSTPPTYEQLRIMLILDKQANGATPTVTEVLHTANFFSFNSLENKNRFRILFDKVFNINRVNMASDGAAVVSTSAVGRYWSYHKKVRTPIEFSGTAGDITEIKSNNFIVLEIARFGTANVTSRWRLRFSDG